MKLPRTCDSYNKGSIPVKCAHLNRPLSVSIMAEKQDHPQTTQASQPPPQNNSNGFGATAPIPRPADASKWSHSFWDCFEPVETCTPASSPRSISHIRVANKHPVLCGWCLPCFLYGKTSARLQDPSMQSDYAANGDVCHPPALHYRQNPFNLLTGMHIVLRLCPPQLLRLPMDRSHAEAR